MKKLIPLTLIVAAIAAQPVGHAAEQENPAIAYRHSLMTLIGHNFGPMAMTVQGEIPWDDDRMAAWGKDLKAVAGLNAMRGFPEGSLEGNTHAKPEIWKNLEDFSKKMESMQLEAAKLGDVAATRDRKAISEQLAATGKTCKSCHDDYKQKDDA